MLKIYSVVLELIKRLRVSIGVIERKDRDLLRRCTASVGLNLAEGQYSRGKNRAARYHSALGSAREMARFVMACFEVTEALGYVPPLSADLRADFDRVIGTLVRLVERSG